MQFNNFRIVAEHLLSKNVKRFAHEMLKKYNKTQHSNIVFHNNKFIIINNYSNRFKWKLHPQAGAMCTKLPFNNNQIDSKNELTVRKKI